MTAARLAASLGANVLLIDKERLGGDCLNYGCVPSKSLIYVAKVVHQAQNAAKIGLKAANLVIDMTKINNYIQGVIGQVADSEKSIQKASLLSLESFLSNLPPNLL